MARIVVVGAGVGGLAVSARLAAQGHHVTVCEQADTYGGKLGTYSRDGFTFDTGPSLLTLPAVYRDLFNKTGDPLESSVDLVPVDPAGRYRFADGTWLDIPNASRGRTAHAFDTAFGPGTGEDWNRLLDRAGDIWALTRGPILSSPLPGARDLARPARRVRQLRTVAPWRSLRGLGLRHLGDPRLRTYLERYATYTGSDPRRAPAALAVVPYVEQTFGCWYVSGGLRRLGDALYERCLERGVSVRLGTGVAEVTTSGGAADGVRLASGGRLRADVVVTNTDATHLYRDLLSPCPAPGSAAGSATGSGVRSVRARLGRATPSPSGFVLLLALRSRPRELSHRTVLFGPDSDTELDAIFGRQARPVPEPTICLAAPNDPALRPDEESQAVLVLVNAPRQGRDGQAGTLDWDAPWLADSYADQILAQLAARGLELRDRLLWRQIRTPADLERSTRSPGGAIYGTSSNGARAAFLRPANRSPVRGLFLVGGSAHPGGGLPLVGMSAAIVAELIGPA